MEGGYGQLEEGEVVLCEDVETEHPRLAAFMLARDAIWIQKVRDVRPSFEAVTWSELCSSLRDVAFAGLATIYSEEYYKEIYVGTGLRRLNGKIAFVMRPATEEDLKKNAEAREKIKIIQSMYDAAHEVMSDMKIGKDGKKKEEGGVRGKKSNAWSFH
jgi:nicotinamide mononucleotide adenylyltransferase